MSRIKAKKQGAINYLLFTNQDNNTGMIAFDGSTFAITKPLAITGATTIVGAFTPTGIIYHPDGTAAAPSLAFTSDTNVGIYRSAADTLGFSTAGTAAVTIDSAGKVSILRTPTSLTAAALEIGSYGTPLVDAAASNNLGLCVNLTTATSKTNPGDGSYGAYISVATTTGATTTNTQLTGVVANAKLNANCFAAYGLQGQLNLSTFKLNASGTGAAVAGKVTIGAANPGGCIASGYFTIEGAFSSAATTYGTWIDIVGSTVTAGLCISTVAGVVGSGILFSSTTATGFTHAFKFAHNDKSEGAYASGWVIDAATTPAAMIKIDIAGTDYYIPAFDAGEVDDEWAD